MNDYTLEQLKATIRNNRLAIMQIGRDIQEVKQRITQLEARQSNYPEEE